MLEYFLEFINTYIFGPGLCAAVFLGGIYFLLRLGPSFLFHPQRLLMSLHSGGGSGMSPIRAMIVALAGTLGVGNIAGVASAIAIGGAGAVFWMLVSAVAALPIKYAEIVLALRHRRRDSMGTPHGGAYFYIADRGTRSSKLTASVFAVLCLAASLAMGCAVQSNAIAVTVSDTLGLPPIVCGLAVGVLTLTVAAGGLKRIALLTEKLIPLMSGIYILMSLYIIGGNLPLLGEIVRDIVTAAFDLSAVGGGVIGFITSRALRIGVTRGIVSNESGCGTAPIAHASAETASPASQGVWGMLEVFIDTVVICTLTAFVVLIAQKHGTPPVTDGMAAAVNAFGVFIPFAEPILCISVAVFAFCTIVCWFYYGTESLAYLTQSTRARYAYLIVYSACAVVGGVVSDGIVWSFSDLTISAMCAVNLVAVMLGAKEIKRETDNYFCRKECKIVNNDIPILHNTVAKSRKV